MGTAGQHTALVAADTGFGAQTGLPVNTVSHNAHIDQMGVRCHKGVYTGVTPLPVQNAGAEVGTGLGVETAAKAIFFVIAGVPDMPSLLCFSLF